ncbi:NAD(P)-binding protein [Mycena belliarum]|uniref:NAD(P)-binding protein n=1 Tax=Mycena belliarum TaxID=1033014 RepID=A0AAD6Y0H4_9AGAR|nr:NAD(P)-binding protein [Mycena belliae]
MGSIRAHVCPPPFLPERDMPDLTGKITLVTGGNTGIGYQTVKQLLLKNATVYLAARTPDKAAAAIKQLEEETKRTAVFLQLDLADLRSVRTAAEVFLAKETRLDILFNNAGVMNCPTSKLTAQNHDLQFGTNVIGHFFLTELLIPALTRSYEETKVPARILNTSSIGHELAPGDGVDFASLKGGPERDAWLKATGDSWKLYGESKMGNVFISNYFATKHADVLVSCAVHPGGIKSDIGRDSPMWMRAMSTVLFYPAPMGAYTQLWGATIATPAEINGQYLVPFGKVGKADKRAANVKVQEEVIAYIQKQLKGF